MKGKTDPETAPRNPLALLVKATIWVFGLLLFSYVASQIALALLGADPRNRYAVALQMLLGNLSAVSSAAWEFAKPLLQLVVVFLILDWIFGKLGVSFSGRRRSDFEWNIQTLIAVMVVGAFTIAALSGISGAGVLKDLALVVVGFYFGSQKRSIELKGEQGGTTIVEEHQNETRLKQAEQDEVDKGEGVEDKRD